MPPLTRASLERWMYRKDGMDYGPFSVREVELMLEDGDLDGQSEIINYRSKTVVPISQVPQFADFLAQKEKRDQEAARKAEIQKDHNTAIKDTKRRHTLPLIMGLMFLVAGSVGAWALLRDPEMPTSGYPVTFFRELEVPVLNKMQARLASPVEVVREKAKKKSASKRRRRSKSRYSTAPGVVPQPVLDFSFGNQGKAVTRKLSADDLNRLKGSVTGGLIRCFQRELSNVEGFEGGKIVFYVMPRGKVALSKVKTSPHASKSLVTCVSRTVNSKKVPPYAGDIQIIEIPLYVSAQ